MVRRLKEQSSVFQAVVPRVGMQCPRIFADETGTSGVSVCCTSEFERMAELVIQENVIDTGLDA
jgi:hypothetical protein